MRNHSLLPPSTGMKCVENSENSAGLVEQNSSRDQCSDSAHSSEVLRLSSLSFSLPFPELIAEQQAASAQPVEDVSNGPDFASERAQSALDRLFLASAHRQAVEDWDMAVLRGDEAAELGQHAGHADLLDEGGFSGAVGTEDELVRREGSEEEIVRDDGVGGSEGV